MILMEFVAAELPENVDSICNHNEACGIDQNQFFWNELVLIPFHEFSRISLYRNNVRWQQ